MIRCNNVKLVGTLASQPQIRKDKNEEEFIAFEVSVLVPVKDGEGYKQTISVAMGTDGLVNATRPVGTRVQLEGTMTFHKTMTNSYVNLSASSISADDVPGEDSVTGEIDFKGTTGQDFLSKTDKNGKPYLIFSAYSTEKISENDYTYTWVRFIQFDTTQPDWMKTMTGIHAIGKLKLSAYKDRRGTDHLEIGCTAKSVEPWDKTASSKNQ